MRICDRGWPANQNHAGARLAIAFVPGTWPCVLAGDYDIVRWEGNRERFKIEATSHGLNRLSDDYYRHWPFEISAASFACRSSSTR
jgi:hypothetical protein